jgi:hypothetical protein
VISISFFATSSNSIFPTPPVNILPLKNDNPQKNPESKNKKPGVLLGSSGFHLYSDELAGAVILPLPVGLTRCRDNPDTAMLFRNSFRLQNQSAMVFSVETDFDWI